MIHREEFLSPRYCGGGDAAIKDISGGKQDPLQVNVYDAPLKMFGFMF